MSIKKFFLYCASPSMDLRVITPDPVMGCIKAVCGILENTPIDRSPRPRHTPGNIDTGLRRCYLILSRQ